MRGETPSHTLPLAHNAAYIMPSAFYAPPPYSSVLGPALGVGAGGTTLGEWEHNNILYVFIFQIILISDVFFSFKINFLLVVYLKI